MREPLAAEPVEHRLPRMTKRRMSQIVPQRDRLRQRLIQPQRFCDRARYLRYFQRVRQARPVMVALRRQKNLRFLFQTPERFAVQNTVAIYLILALRKACENLPEALEKIAPVLIYPVVGVLLIGLVMSFVVEPVMGAINMALNNGLSSMGGSSKLILGFVLAAMMAIDMGGPFNKAAYVFGTAAIASGNYDVMAAVMIGGMTPPCAIALATMLFKKKFTKEEREAGPTNFIMGLAFITEGAIPFAASDPVHVLPACIVGSGVAGAMSMLFNCTLMAPHGGIFVFPVMGNPLFYLLALVVGTAISTVLLGVLKKNVEE